jgi:hypothetical protein
MHFHFFHMLEGVRGMYWAQSRMYTGILFFACMHTHAVLRHPIVTHYFGHPDDDYINMCSGSQYNLFPEKRNLFPPFQDAFLEGHHRLLPLHSAEIPDFRMLHYNHPAGFLQDTI